MRCRTKLSKACGQRQRASAGHCFGVWCGNRGWKRIENDGGLDGTRSFHIDVYRGTEFMCRLALSGRFPDYAAAEEGLGRCLEAWIEDYNHRPHFDRDRGVRDVAQAG